MTEAPAIWKVEDAKALVGVEGSCVSAEEHEITILVHPKYSGDTVAGVKKELNSLSRRYSKELGGVVMAYEKVQLKSAKGWLFDTNPFTHLRVSAHFIVFCPAAEKTLKAVVRKKTPHHLGCLAHGSFNVSVPRPPRELVEDWAGTLADEGDTLMLTVVFTSLTSYLMPYIRAFIHPNSVRELQERAATRAVAEVEGPSASKLVENDSANLPNSRTIFDNDSGISSNEAGENGRVQKRKRSEESEEKEDKEDVSRERKRRKKDNDGKDEDTGMKKRRKKKTVDDNVANGMVEEDREGNEVRRKKRKRNEEEDIEEENIKKKKQKRISDSHSEAVRMKTEKDQEEHTTLENVTPSKKKKSKKNNLERQPNAETGKNIEARETISPHIKIKMEKMSSDEAEEKGKKKKKKLQQEEEKEDEKMRKTIRNLKQERPDDTDWREESISKGRKGAIVSMGEKSERRSQSGEDKGEETTTNSIPSLSKKKKQKIKIKEESAGSSTDNMPIPLFMIKREKGTPESRIKAKIKKENG